MRSSILFIAAFFLLISFSVEAAPYEYGCCLPTNDNCIAGSNPPFVIESAFQQACVDAEDGGTPQYATGSVCLDKCSLGCSCATANVAGRDVINSTEDLLRMTRHAHDQRTSATATYHWKRLSEYPTGSKCVDICGGGGSSSTTPPAPSYTVRGTVRNSTGAMRDVAISFHTGGEQPVTVKTDVSGQYTTTLTGAKSYLLVAVPPASSPQCEPRTLPPFTLTNNKIQDLAIQCATSVGCTNTKPSISVPASLKGTDGATFSITYDDRCNSFEMFVPFRCEGANCNTGWTALPSSVGKTITDSGLKPQTDYCYYVRATNAMGFIESDKKCFKTGDQACMSLPPNSPTTWCGTAGGVSAILSCDDRNLLVTNRCENKVCMIAGSTPACIEKVPCAKCNGLLGLFAKIGLTIPDGGKEERHVTCGTSDASQCYMDRETTQPLLFDAYSSCTAIDDCADYRSPYACSNNPCKAGSGTSAACQWKELQSELGGGVCVSTASDAVPPCRQCNDFFGTCTREMCAAISSQCYFDAPTDEAGRLSNGFRPQGCIPMQEMACRFYDTPTDCIGPSGAVRAATYAITYDGEKRTGTTNIRTNSNDLFGFGACRWVEASNRCIKDADNFSPDNEDDCFQDVLTTEARTICLRDVTPPTTEFILKAGSPPEYGSSEITTLPIRVIDDFTSPDRITTYACIVKTGSCYPDKRLGQLMIADENADYTIYYYSIDAHHNSEEVKSQQLRVKKDDIPRLNVDITESER
jgi:hypothetical protein